MNGTSVIAVDSGRRWIDHVAIAPDGAVAWSAGKQAFARAAKGLERSLDVPSTVGGLDFTPKGYRLAVAHYNGVTLWFPNAEAEPELEWKVPCRCVGQSGRSIRPERHAGADPARLAARRPQGHAHVGLRRACARSTGAPAANGSQPRAPPS